MNESSLITQFNKISIVAIIVLLFTGISVRFYLIDKYFTHIDDLGVALSIDRVKTDQDAEWQKIVDKVMDSRVGEIINTRGQHIQKKITDLGLDKPLLYLSKLWFRIHNVSINYTYAPGQFYLTNQLVKPGQDYVTTKFMGRLPSLMLGVGGLVLLGLVIANIGNKTTLQDRVLLAIALGALSWEQIIYSVQMESYAVIVFSITCLLFLLVKIQSSQFKSYREAIGLGFVLFILSATQYQVLFFMPGFFIALFVKQYSHDQITKLIKFNIVSVICFLIPVVLLLFPFLMARPNAGINWNGGLKNEFVLDITGFGNNIFDYLKGIISFFLHNTPDVVTAMLSPVAETNVLLPFISIVLLLLMLLGFVTLAKSKSPEYKSIKVFIFVTIIIWFILLLTKKITFSPTRHSMALIPIFILLITEGMGQLIVTSRQYFPQIKSITPHPIVLGFVLVWLLLFSLDAQEVIRNRIDKFNESEILAKLSQDKVDIVLNYDSSYQLYFMNDVRKNYALIDANLMMGKGEYLTKMTNYGKPLNIINKNPPLIVALYSNLHPYTMVNYMKVLNSLAEHYYINKPIKFELLREEHIESNTQIEWSSKTENGSNGFYYSVFLLHE